MKVAVDKEHIWKLQADFAQQSKRLQRVELEIAQLCRGDQDKGPAPAAPSIENPAKESADFTEEEEDGK